MYSINNEQNDLYSKEREKEMIKVDAWETEQDEHDYLDKYIKDIPQRWGADRTLFLWGSLFCMLWMVTLGPRWTSRLTGRRKLTGSLRFLPMTLMRMVLCAI